MTATGSSQRLFFGIAVPQSAHPGLLAARSHCAFESPTSKPAAKPETLPVRLTRPANWHLTLAFLGQVAPQRLGCVHRAAARAPAQAFRIELDQLGHWPRPQVLWAAPTNSPTALARLVDSLQAGLRPCGFTPEQRRYAPHLTLARKVRRVARLAALPTQGWTVSQFHLYQSLSTPSGVVYRIIDSWALH